MKNKTLRLTTAQALVKFLTQQYITHENGHEERFFAGVFSIFGHGNVAALGEALYHHRDTLPTYRGHNEQSMAHTAIAYAKENNRRRMMACTTSIGPGAANMITAAALAHVNRLPVLFLPGDIFASRAPDPVLQQVECEGDATVSVNDCFKSVSRFWDRIMRPEQLIHSLRLAVQVLTDPAQCGPVTICLPQDVQAEAFDFPVNFFEKKIHRIERRSPELMDLERLRDDITLSKSPLIIAGGGIKYSIAFESLGEFSQKTSIPVATTQAGKSCLIEVHPMNIGSIGVTGTSTANALAAKSDLVISIGSRLQDFTTGSKSIFKNPDTAFWQINVNKYDAGKLNGSSVIADADKTLKALFQLLPNYTTSDAWQGLIKNEKEKWKQTSLSLTGKIAPNQLPSDAQVIRCINEISDERVTVVAAAGGLPGELHRHWISKSIQDYHLEYGFSCMGYEIAGGLGVKIARPEREVVVMVGDGSYLMLNSELATSVSMGKKINLVILDNNGFGCINRLQQGTGNRRFNNIFNDDSTVQKQEHSVDFVQHVRSLGGQAEFVNNLSELKAAFQRSLDSSITYAVVIKSDPEIATTEGGSWWQVGIPEVSALSQVEKMHQVAREERRKNKTL